MKRRVQNRENQLLKEKKIVPKGHVTREVVHVIMVTGHVTRLADGHEMRLV
jgi:hypothetical protein